MKLINITPADFLKEVIKCEGEVWMCSKFGDKLNLKSQLSQYLFLSALLQEEYILNCRIECEDASDAGRLAAYWK